MEDARTFHPGRSGDIKRGAKVIWSAWSQKALWVILCLNAVLGLVALKASNFVMVIYKVVYKSAPNHFKSRAAVESSARNSAVTLIHATSQNKKLSNIEFCS